MTTAEALRIFELTPGASASEIKKAYHDYCKVWHPDRFHDPHLRDLAGRKQRELNEAYRILSQAAPLHMRHEAPPREQGSHTRPGPTPSRPNYAPPRSTTASSGPGPPPGSATHQTRSPEPGGSPPPDDASRTRQAYVAWALLGAVAVVTLLFRTCG
jgi:hypothetical protein